MKCPSLFFLLLLSTGLRAAENASARLFHEQVAPLLIKHCVECHNETTTKGGLNLETLETTLKGGDEGPAVVPGNAEESLLYRMVIPKSAAEEAEMPKKKPALSTAETDLMKQWIDNGADWPKEIVLKEKPKGDLTHWAFQPLHHAAPGQPTIDSFITARLHAQGLKLNPPADPRTFIRRATFDLTGLPPTPEETQAFIHDFHRDAESSVRKLVDRLLESPRYGERWARHWLDVVRFAESHGFEMNRARTNAWPYRDYVIDSFNADKPYDEFVREQIAGDQLGAHAATGFLVAGAWDQVKGADPALRANQRADELHDLVSTASSTFLGLTVGCARCHDHKFDPVSQVDYFRLRGIFEGVQHGERELTPADAATRLTKAESLRREIAKLDDSLAKFQPKARLRQRVLVDDALPPPTRPDAIGCVQIEQPSNGKPITYTPGTHFGQASDPGDSMRLPNLGESYRYWQTVRDAPAQDLFSWHPRVAGRQHVWLSWGAWTTHAKDARYILDLDGDVSTRGDQKEIAMVDQSKFADGSGAVPNEKRWSGFRHAGTHLLRPESIILLRSGRLGGPTVADALLLEEADGAPAAQQPHVRAPVTHLANHENFEPVPARFVRFTIHATSGSQPCLDELEIFAAGRRENVALASLGAKATASDVYNDGASPIHQTAHVNDGQYGNARSWISRHAGQGWVQVELPQETKVASVTWSRDRGDPRKGRVYQDRLPTQYVIEVSRDGRTWVPVASSADRLPQEYRDRIHNVPTLTGVANADAGAVKQHSERRASLQQELRELTTFPTAYLGKFEQPGPTFRLHRGDPLMPKEEITPGALSQVGPRLELAKDTPEAERRLALAHWITHPNNPLTARVMVNRLWHYHFGTGIVDTPSDLGFNGGKPSHPELLDWLAAEFLRGGWRMKEMHRLIMTSQAYRQASTAHEAGMQKDSGARLLWRFPPRRIEAEALRDAVLSVSGVLDLTMGGPGFDLFEPNDNYVKVYQSKAAFGPETFRRMIYQSKPRVQLDDTFGAFDVPDAGQIAPRRTSSTTPLQALNFLNSAFALQQADLLARRLEKEAGSTPASQVQRAFQLAFNRAAAPDEIEASLPLITAHGLPMFCRALFNSSEFMMLY